ncbi:MAG TPA: FecR domain-containing protein [Opitutaceae bacterium]|nr:FecR domain-containing protein [Opitutaceae bacterium]
MNSVPPQHSSNAGHKPRNPEIDRLAAEWVARADAGLNSTEAHALETWRAENPDHDQAFRRFSGAWSNFDRPLASGQTGDVYRELSLRATHRRRRRWAAGMTAVAVLTITGFFWNQPVRDSSSPFTEPAQARLITPSSQTLPDGSIVELREGAQIRVAFTEHVRRVELQSGEAHFQVAPDPTKPFIVSAAGIEARAVGTGFVVQRGENTIEVVVTHGRVSVDRSVSTASPTADSLALLEVGDGIAVIPSTTESTRASIRVLDESHKTERLAWRTPKLEFSGTPLIEAINLLNRHNQRQLSIEDPQLEPMRVTGMFGATSVDAFVRVLETSFDVHAEHRSDGYIVLRRNSHQKKQP